jgi:hypothetical protein
MIHAPSTTSVVRFPEAGSPERLGPPATLDAVQREAADELINGPRRGVHGPFRSLLHRPPLLRAVAKVGESLRYEGTLDERPCPQVGIAATSMECFRRAALSEQTFAGRELGLKYGEKLARTYAALVETLDRQPRQGAAAGCPGRARHSRGRRAGDRRRGDPGWGRGLQ